MPPRAVETVQNITLGGFRMFDFTGLVETIHPTGLGIGAPLTSAGNGVRDQVILIGSLRQTAPPRDSA